MATSAKVPASRLYLHISVVIALLVLGSLGVWQLYRLQWKTALLERIAASQTAPPEPLAPVLNRIADKVPVDYVRVQLNCPALETAPVERLYGVGDDGAQVRLIAACPIEAGPYRSLLVDRGFAHDPVPPGAASLSAPLIGVLRRPEKKSWLTPPHTAPGAVWYSRDIDGMAKALHAPSPAPLMLMLESPAPAAGNPKPSPTPVNISNNHLIYALTWFGLALALISVYIAMLRKKR